MHFFAAKLLMTYTYVRHVRLMWPMSSEPTDLLQIINFSHTKMHATAARALTHDTTIVWWLFSREPFEYPQKLYTARN